MQHETKYARMVAFGSALPALRRQVAADLGARGLPRQKVLALIAHLLERTMIRIGNREYRRANGSFGLTTLLDRHVQVEGTSIRFRFRGKGGKLHDVAFADPRVARLVRNCQELPGSQLFQYVDGDGSTGDVTSTDVNEYLRTAMGEAFTAKDFRTWSGTVLAAEALHGVDFDSRTAAERHVVTAIEAVSRILGNTRAICRRCYVHPGVVETFLDGRLSRALRPSSRWPRVEGLGRMEAAVLGLLRRRIATDASKAA
jgi:DNA topoisomerase-1